MPEICVGDIRSELVKDLGNLLERIFTAKKNLPHYYVLIKCWWELNTLRTRAVILKAEDGAVLAKQPLLNTLLLEINNRTGIGHVHWCLPADMPIDPEALKGEEVAQVARSVIETGVPIVWN